MDEPVADEWLFEVEEVFNLSSIGLIIGCNLEKSSATLRVGDALVFLCADGSEIETSLKSIPLISRSLRHPESWNLVSIELPKTPETLQIKAGDQAFRRAAST